MTNNATIHVAGSYDPVLGQLCSRCGHVLDSGLEGKRCREGEEPSLQGWPEGEEILVYGGFSANVKYLLKGRDTSDEIPCELGGE